MTNNLEVRRIVASMENEEPNDKEQEQPGTTEQEPVPAETIHIHYFPDAIVIVRDDEVTTQEDNTVETTIAKPKQPPIFIAYAVCGLYLFLILATLAFQVYEILNPPIATVTIIPKSQTVTLTGTLQLGRLVNPLTISQSQTAPTTGKGYQSAKSATGFITFYNGQFTEQTIAAGMILTGSDATQVITDQEATIPKANPPSFGQVSVSAHAIIPGARGNIPGYDITVACCAPSVYAKNTNPFTGGQDERNYQTVAKSDIATTALPLKTAITQSMQAALQGQMTSQEQLYVLPCTPTVTSDRQPGQEATHVTVTVSQTCNAVVYNAQELTIKVTQLLTSQATKKYGAGYSILGNPQITVTQVTPAKQVTLSFTSVSTWVYALSSAEQNHIKTIIVGKTKENALQLLNNLPGVEHVSLQFSGFGDDTRIPKEITQIHLAIMYGLNY